MVTTVGNESTIQDLVQALLYLEHDAIAAYDSTIEKLVALASLMGDGAILTAMRTNEDDTVTAYERASTHGGAAPEFRTFFAEFAADERRHREWMQQTAAAA